MLRFDMRALSPMLSELPLVFFGRSRILVRVGVACTMELAFTTNGPYGCVLFLNGILSALLTLLLSGICSCSCGWYSGPTYNSKPHCEGNCPLENTLVIVVSSHKLLFYVSKLLVRRPCTQSLATCLVLQNRLPLVTRPSLPVQLSSI